MRTLQNFLEVRKRYHEMMKSAHAEWGTENTKEPFTAWLRNHCHELSTWAYDNGGLTNLALDDDEYEALREQKRQLLIHAFEEWKQSSEGKQSFNIAWLKEHNYYSLYTWAKANGGIQLLLHETADQRSEVREKFRLDVDPRTRRR